MNDYLTQALDYLKLAYDPDRALFSYSTRVDDMGSIVSDFRRQASLRYTINTYLGLSEAQRFGTSIDWLGDVENRVHQFLELHERSLISCADHGLLLVLLAATDPADPAVGRSLDRLSAIAVAADAARALNMQDLAWMLWGAASCAQDERASVLAEKVFSLIRTQFLYAASGLPRHSIARYRPHTVSFGSVVYFLRAMYEYSEAFESQTARDLFAAGVERVLTIQEADGAWPWMIDARSGRVFDRYPVFTVHQDSMAMLFLLPAEQLGLPGVSGAIERSLRWNFGHNELGAQMVVAEPYPWIYRSIERDERFARARRYLRGLAPPNSENSKRNPRIRVNRECRSYHLGWVLYAWSDPARVFPFEATVTRV